MKKVIVGMSGGVDSSVSALLLKEKGYEVCGVFMKIWDERFRGLVDGNACFSPEDRDIEDVKNVAEAIGIKIYIIDLTKEFSEVVLDYFKKEYLSGRTPNPCVVCNRFLKFGILIERCRKEINENFDLFATGHYARVEYDRKSGRYILKKGKDREKDQSYFLFLLTQNQLSEVIFPLGEYTKKDVWKIANDYKLPVSNKKESQDFVKGDISHFFSGDNMEGEIVDSKGNILGRHKGIAFYTIGQRKGTGVAKGKPLYVGEIDSKNRRIVLVEEKDVYKKEFVVERTNWVSIEGIKEPLKAEVKIRYKHKQAPATIYPLKGNCVRVVFETPQWAITPGQAGVFYDGDILLGGGFIETVYG